MEFSAVFQTLNIYSTIYGGTPVRRRTLADRHSFNPLPATGYYIYRQVEH